MTDSELIILLKNDPERGLAETVDKYSGYVYKIAYSKLSARTNGRRAFCYRAFFGIGQSS